MEKKNQGEWYRPIGILWECDEWKNVTLWLCIRQNQTYCPSQFYIVGIGNFTLFCCCKLDLDLMTFLQAPDPCPPTKNTLSTSRFSKVIYNVHAYRQISSKTWPRRLAPGNQQIVDHQRSAMKYNFGRVCQTTTWQPSCTKFIFAHVVHLQGIWVKFV